MGTRARHEMRSVRPTCATRWHVLGTLAGYELEDIIMSIRVLKGHRQAVLDALKEAAGEGLNSDELALRVARSVLEAHDLKTAYMVVTSDNIGYGPFANAESARKAIDKGHCAFHESTKAIIIPTRPVPTAAARKMGSRLVKKKQEGEQLTLF
jgi:hypothetical protein